MDNLQVLTEKYTTCIKDKPYLVALFRNICGDPYVITDEDELSWYSKDQTGNFRFTCDILLKPGTADEIAAVLRVCNRYHIPVTPRGGGTGVTGGALPVYGGIILSMERLNKILTVNQQDRYVMAEAGVITAHLCKAVEEAGLYFPVAPTSSASCFIGGNVAENAGSTHSCKFGSTGDYVLNLEVVLPTGDIIWTGGQVKKNATGLNLTQLFVGSEGVLGIITKVVYRLLPLPGKDLVLRASFETISQACKAVVALKGSVLIPASVELVTIHALKYATEINGRTSPLIQPGDEAWLIVELQETDPQYLLGTILPAAIELLEGYTQKDILVAEAETEKRLLRQLRADVGDALANCRYHYRDVDATIPVSWLNSYIEKVYAVCSLYGLTCVCFGHALDGNLHMMLIINEQFPEAIKINQALLEIYSFVIANGGVISGEHGIGYLQKDFMRHQFTEPHLALLRGIKNIFDPVNILNPGKVI
jgi:glycolate oxidase